MLYLLGFMLRKTFSASTFFRSASFIIFLCMTVSGCSDDTSEKVRVGIPSIPGSLDPRFGSDAVSVRLQQLLHRSLVVFDDHMRPIPDLATWEILSPLLYRFSLVGEPKFNDGSRIRAQDIVSTYHSILEPKTLSPHLGSLQNISLVKVVDINTVDFHLNQADLFFPATLVLGILSAENIAASVSIELQKSSGDFEVFRGSEDAMLLRRRKDGTIFEFLSIKDANARALRLIAGEIDILQGDISPSIYNHLLSYENLRGMRARGATFSYLGFNLGKGVTSEPDLRQAVALAINREELLEFLFKGTARMASAIFPPEHWAGAGNLPKVRYDPAEARALVSQLEDIYGPITLTYKTSTNKFRQRIATVIKSQLAAVGIELQIERLDFSTLMRDVTTSRFQLYSLSWVGLNSPDIFRQIFHSTSLPPSGKNRGRYQSVHADRLIEAAEKEVSFEARSAIYRKLELHLLKELPYFPLWFEDQLTVWNSSVEGYKVDSTGSYKGLLDVKRVEEL